MSRSSNKAVATSPAQAPAQQLPLYLTTAAPLPKFLTAQDMRNLFKISDKTLQRWRNSNKIAYMIKGRGYLYPGSDVQRFVSLRTVQAA